MTSRDPKFQAAVNQRVSALSPRMTVLVTLAGIVLGMILYAVFGPNDIWTALMVGGVFGGMGAGLAIRLYFSGIEAMATRRLELAVVAGGVALVLTIWYMAR